MAQQQVHAERKVSITEHVIASIAGMAASSVDGISDLRGNVTENLKVILGDERGRRGVIARVRDDVVSVTLYVSVEYGYPIQDVARTLQAHVKTEIEEMTGLLVQGVHVYVSDLTLPEGAWPGDEDAAMAARETGDDGPDAEVNGDGDTDGSPSTTRELGERS